MRVKVGMKKIVKVIALSMAITMAAPVAAPLSAPVTVSAATKVKLNTKEKFMYPGESFNLKVKGAKKVTFSCKNKFSSTDKKVVTVSKKGEVIAKNPGYAVVYAKVGKKKLACDVFVERKNQYVKNAPYEANEYPIYFYSAALPKDWYYKEEENSVKIFPEDINGTCMISIDSDYSEASNEDYDQLKEVFDEANTEEFWETLLSSEGDNIKVSNLKSETVKVGKNKVCKTSFTITDADVNMEMVSYYLWADNCKTVISSLRTEDCDYSKEKFDEVTEYILKSLTYRF